jgi:hypothetical protein
MSDATSVRSGEAAPGGCSFIDRCSLAMAECAKAVPPLYRTEADRAVACYRYRTSPELAAEDLGAVLAGGQKTAASN